MPRWTKISEGIKTLFLIYKHHSELAPRWTKISEGIKTWGYVTNKSFPWAPMDENQRGD